ncbi:hypothetical protein As57867_011639, partial [Aphanomyces stellatus]
MEEAMADTMDLSKKHAHGKGHESHGHEAHGHGKGLGKAHDVHSKGHGHAVHNAHESQVKTHVDKSLKILVTLSRHGSRRPNEITATLCPKNAHNSGRYEVPPEQLTEVGMEQLRKAGEEIRREYIDVQQFLSHSASGDSRKHLEAYFRSDSAERCAQSAIALGYGLYPDGTGPRPFHKQPIANFMQLLPNEHDFAAPKGPCKAVAKADVQLYFEKRAQELIAQHKPMLEKVGDLCGINVWDIPTLPNGEDIVTGIKDIADTFTFDTQEGLPRLDGLTPELQSEIEGLAFQNLMERYYSTDRQITYWVGGFSNVLLKNLHVPTVPADETYKYYSYHCHRELLHGLGKLLGWDYDFKGQPRAMNTTALDPGTTLFFELHQVNNTTAPFVRTFVWSPTVPRTPVKLGKCSQLDCPLSEFTAIITGHVNQTGTWQQICNFQPQTYAPVATHPATTLPAVVEEKDTTTTVAPATTTTTQAPATSAAITHAPTTTTTAPTTT